LARERFTLLPGIHFLFWDQIIMAKKITHLHTDTIEVYGSLIAKPQNEIDVARDAWLQAFDALNKSKTEANLQRVRETEAHLTEVRRLYREGRELLNEFLCERMRNEVRE
jgi:hypothetical protein